MNYLSINLLFIVIFKHFKNLLFIYLLINFVNKLVIIFIYYMKRPILRPRENISCQLDSILKYKLSNLYKKLPVIYFFNVILIGLIFISIYY